MAESFLFCISILIWARRRRWSPISGIH
jgi:hypothetical protein